MLTEQNNTLEQSTKKTDYIDKAIKFAMGTVFFSSTIDSVIDTATFFKEYEPMIKEYFGNVGYWGLQVGVPIGTAAMMGLLGYIAVKGAGEYLRKP